MGVAKRLQLPEDHMGDQWNQWVGQIIDGKFRLGECRESSEFAAVFVCESVQGSTAATLIKLLRCDAENAPEQAESWTIAAKLSHPNLIRVLAAGKTKLADTEFYYAVTERGEFELTQMLAERALTPAETEEMLHPTLDALEYLHAKGFVHGDLRPQNVMVISETLKLSTDALCQPGIREVQLPGSDAYRAPEQKAGEVSPAADVWSLGMTIAEALTRRVPSTLAIENHSFKQSMPRKFQDIVQHCLVRDAQRRWGTKDIRARLTGVKPAEGADEIEMLRQVAQKVAPSTQAPTRRRNALPVLFLLAVIAAGASAFFLMRNKPTTQATQPAVKNESPAPASVPAQPAAQVPQKVLRQVLPKPSQSASDTITGTIRVRVKVNTDENGNVSNAVLDSAGPSRYFARLALESARQWEFTPGRSSTWLLQFQFRQDGVKAIPELRG
jgi:TonB family protein